MLGRLKITSKILTLVVVPTLGMLFFSASTALEKYGAAVRLEQTAELVDLASDVSVLAHGVQREAAASAAFVSGGGDGASLPDLARATAEAERTVRQRLQTYDVGKASGELKTVLDDGLAGVDGLGQMRSQVSARSVPAAQMNAAFTAATVRLLDFSLAAPKAIEDANVNRSMRLYAYLLQAAEASSAARANAAVGFGAGRFDLATWQAVARFLTRQGDFTALIEQAATPAQRDFFAATYSGRPVEETARMVQAMTDAGPGGSVASVTQEAWLAANAERMKLYGEVEKRFERDLRAAAAEAKGAAQAQLETQIVLTAVLLAVTGTLAFLIARGITRPMKALVSSMDKLANGNTAAVVPCHERHDEVGEMARSLLVFQQAAIENARLEREAAANRAHMEGERASIEKAQRDGIEQERAIVAGSIGAALSKLAAKELTYRMPPDIPDAYRRLQADFNAAVSNLEETMKTVAVNTSAIRSGTDEMSSASDDLSRRTEQQAASLEETAAALDEITATVRRTAEGSKHARDVVGNAKKAAEHSGQVVRQAVEAMSGIKSSADQIGNIIGVIDEIAFQTNLLALNAGVEAARAGDAGRGFAVVASEVRALAQRSADAAKEIKTLISASSRQVEQGVDLVGQTGLALETIVAQVSEINGIVTEIAASTQEQTIGLDQVNTAVNAMDQVTQQNAAMVEQATAASHSLARETEELAQIIGQFEIGQPTGGAAASRAASRPRAQSGRPAPAFKAASRSEPRAPALAGGDWQDF